MTALFGPCARRRVQAIVTGASGKQYAAENVCLRPQAICPREEGEGYEKCHNVCQTLGHAEEQAIAQAGKDAFGGSIVVNHNYICDGCMATIRAAGIASAQAVGQ